jgi:hypothetical protein
VSGFSSLLRSLELRCRSGRQLDYVQLTGVVLLRRVFQCGLSIGRRGRLLFHDLGLRLVGLCRYQLLLLHDLLFEPLLLVSLLGSPPLVELRGSALLVELLRFGTISALLGFCLGDSLLFIESLLVGSLLFDSLCLELLGSLLLVETLSFQPQLFAAGLIQPVPLELQTRDGSASCDGFYGWHGNLLPCPVT